VLTNHRIKCFFLNPGEPPNRSIAIYKTINTDTNNTLIDSNQAEEDSEYFGEHAGSSHPQKHIADLTVEDVSEKTARRNDTGCQTLLMTSWQPRPLSSSF